MSILIKINLDLKVVTKRVIINIICYNYPISGVFYCYIESIYFVSFEKYIISILNKMEYNKVSYYTDIILFYKCSKQ